MSHKSPNIDKLKWRECFAFWFKHQRGRRHRILFPDGGKGTKRATEILSRYASNIGTAKICRELGRIDDAILYENIAYKLYQSLPYWARW